MKHLFLLFVLLLLSSAVFSQNLTFEDVVRTDSTFKKDELYKRARQWFNKKFNSSQNVLNIQDKETGELAGTGAIEYISDVFVGSVNTKGKIQFEVSVTVKDGRYKYVFTNFIHKGAVVNGYDLGIITNDKEYPRAKNRQSWHNKVFDDIKENINEQIPPFIKSLKEYMSKKGDGDDW